MSCRKGRADPEMRSAKFQSPFQVQLKWFKSFLSNKSFSVSLGARSSSMARLTCGVPQGLILAPLLFSLYMLPLGSTMSKFGVLYHCYADDTQLYIPIQHRDSLAFKRLEAFLQEIKVWLTNYFVTQRR